jgi:hypothetical protein
MSISDVFFRVGGATPGTATTSLEVNSNDVILDVTIHDAGTVFLSGSGSITHVIDNTGNSVSRANAGSFSPVVTYP